MPILYLINELDALKLRQIILLALAELDLGLSYLALNSACVAYGILKFSVLLLQILDELLVIALEFLTEFYVVHS